MNKFIAFDIESGGTEEDTSLLTVFFAILDDKLNLIDELNLALKPDNNKPYALTAGGLAVNKINIIEHDKVAITYSEGGQLLVRLLKKHAVGKDRLTPLGHNVPFDINGICNYLLGRKTWNQFVSYKIQDTQQCATFMQRRGYFPLDMSMSLSSLASHFNIQLFHSGVAHESKYDTLLTIEVYKRLLAL